jgi:hypothetical protein
MRKLGVLGPTPDKSLLFPGELRRDGEQLRIFFSPNQSSQRLRFTLAHELGHAVLHKTGPRCPQRGEVVEHVCNRIAAEILMPTEDLRARYREKPSIDTIHSIADVYAVSRTAAALRVSDLWRVGAFEVEQGKIVWRSRVSWRFLAGVDASFKEIINKAMQGQSGAEVISVSYGSESVTRHMEWACLSRKQQALFLVT